MKLREAIEIINNDLKKNAEKPILTKKVGRPGYEVEIYDIDKGRRFIDIYHINVVLWKIWGSTADVHFHLLRNVYLCDELDKKDSILIIKCKRVRQGMTEEIRDGVEQNVMSIESIEFVGTDPAILEMTAEEFKKVHENHNKEITGKKTEEDNKERTEVEDFLSKHNLTIEELTEFLPKIEKYKATN